MKGFFGSLFDFNKDGKLDTFERTMDFVAFQKAMSSSDKDNTTLVPHYQEESDDSDELEETLEEAGIDSFDFEFMDDDEKREALEEAGLDPWDYDL